MGLKEYDYQIDLWSYGCLVAEIIKGVPLLSGINEIDQLSKISQLLGCPCIDHWPNLAIMPDYQKISFNYSDSKLHTIFYNILDSKNRNIYLSFIQNFLTY